ncbi:high-affinity branched-chain amino acid ABC transporter permease LivM [Pollutimonas bauzanensis]|jgi:branched-chain amino acid transport system permease protein|uniref:high-affinity branched-chain amino acid ABC transporter permease LivM n=1 Tax=Pollutimonas bauzanensis TaxID=658167 RepID=UPI0033423662
MGNNVKNALIAAFMAGVIIAPIFGLQIVRVGMQTHLKPEWDMIVGGMAIVFVFQVLVRPFFARLFAGKGTKRAMPVLPESARRGLIFLLVAIAVIFPFFTGRAHVDIATLVLIYIMLGLGLNIVVGFAGLLDLGFVGFYAVGAYTYALLYHWAGWGFWQALPLAGAMSALFGFVLGFPVLRLRGDYLAIVTLGFGEIIRLLLINMYSFTGGPDGISGIPKPTVFGFPMARRAAEGQTTFHELVGWTFSNQDVIVYLYLTALCMALFALYVSNRVIRMPIGRAWEALREDEIACRSLGLNPTRIKLSAFTMGATFAGLGGAFFAARQGLVNPESFTFMESALILAIVVLGGMGSQVGVILAAIVLTVVPEIAREFAEYRMLIFGLVMVLMMMWRPQGLLPVKRPQVELKA